MRYQSLVALLAAVGGGLAGRRSTITDEEARYWMDNKRIFVAFVHQQTPEYVRFFPEWRLIESTAPRTPAPPLIMMDCVEYPALCVAEDVTAHPALRMYNKGQMTRYRGPKTAPAVIAYLARGNRPYVVNVTEAEAEAFKTSDEVVVLVRGSNNEVRGIIEETAERYEKMVAFGFIEETNKEASAICWNHERGQTYETPVSPSSFSTFVAACAKPLIPAYTRGQEAAVLSLPTSLVLFHSPSPLEQAIFVEAFRSLALKYAEFLTFVTVDTVALPEVLPESLRQYLPETAPYAPDALDQFGVPVGTIPSGVLTVYNQHTDMTYLYGGVMMEGPVEKWLKAVSSGEVAPIEPEAAPATPSQSGQTKDEL